MKQKTAARVQRRTTRGSDHYVLRTKINFLIRRQHAKTQIQTDTQKNEKSEEINTTSKD